MRRILEELLADRRLWRATDASSGGEPGIPTGFAPLDASLRSRGWPAGALTEILLPRNGIGELRLVMPALVHLSRGTRARGQHADTASGSYHTGAAPRWIAWLAPPWLPYPPALATAGLDLSRVLVVHPRNEADTRWAMEQTLRSGACAAVLAWIERLDDRWIRRLQLAAESGAAWGVLFRPERLRGAASPAALRIALRPAPEGTHIELLKSRGGRPCVLRGCLPSDGSSAAAGLSAAGQPFPGRGNDPARAPG